MEESKRFFVFVDKTDNCWIWKGGLVHFYGIFRKDDRTYVRAHRFSYEQTKGTIPQGLIIDHLCKNTKCVNPDHLEAVTNRVNVLRGQSLPDNHKAKKLPTYCRRCKKVFLVKESQRSQRKYCSERCRGLSLYNH